MSQDNEDLLRLARERDTLLDKIYQLEKQLKRLEMSPQTADGVLAAQLNKVERDLSDVRREYGAAMLPSGIEVVNETKWKINVDPRVLFRDGRLVGVVVVLTESK